MQGFDKQHLTLGKHWPHEILGTLGYDQAKQQVLSDLHIVYMLTKKSKVIHARAIGCTGYSTPLSSPWNSWVQMIPLPMYYTDRM